MRNLTRLLLISLATLGACNTAGKLTVDPCVVWPDDPTQCHGVRLGQPEKTGYDRTVKPLDVCVSIDEWARIQKRLSKTRCE